MTTTHMNIDLATASRAAIEDEVLGRVNRVACLRCRGMRDIAHGEITDARVPANGIAPAGFTIDGVCVREDLAHWLVLQIVTDQPLFGVEEIDRYAHYVGTMWVYDVDTNLIEQLVVAK